MNKQGVKFFLLYTLACQFQKQANFLFRLAGEEYSAHRYQENERTLAAPGDAAQEQGSANPEPDIPPADWAERQEPDGPPAHWLNRVQQAGPEFFTGHGLSAHRSASQIPPLSPKPGETGTRHTSAKSGMPSVRTPGATLPGVAQRKLDQATWRQSERHNLENSTETAEEEGWGPTFAMSEGEYVAGNAEADREGNTTGEYVAGNSRGDCAGNALTMDLFTMHGAQIGRERRVPSLHAGRPEARPISPGEAAQWAVSASLPRRLPRVEAEASFVSKGDAGIVGATRAVGIARVADVTRPAKIVGTTGLADDAQAGGLAGITGDAGIVRIAGAARTAGIAEGEGIAEGMVAAIPASPAETVKFAGTVETAQILEKRETGKERLEQNESRHRPVDHPGNLAVHPQRGDQQSPLPTRKRQASPDTIQSAFMQPVEPARESLVKPETRRSAAAAQQPGMTSPTAHTPQARWPDLPVLSSEQSQPASQSLWPALDVSPATHIYRGSDMPGEQRPAETRWPSLPDETGQTGHASQALTRHTWERQQRLDNEQRGNTWNA